MSDAVDLDEMLRHQIIQSRHATYDMTFLWPQLASLNGYAIALAGRHEDGVALMERALQASMAMRLGQDEALRRAYASEAYLLAGRIDEARDTASGALEYAEQH